jgi:hypothetical protein
MSSLVIHVLDPRLPGIDRLDSYNPCRFLADLGDLLQWTSSRTSLLLEPRIQYWLWSIDSPKWPISPLVPSIVVTYEIHIFFEGAQKEVFSSILKFENVNT